MAGTAVVVKTGSLACSHPPGSAGLSAISMRLTVGGNGVLLKGSESGLAFKGCTNQTTSNPIVSAACVSDAATAGIATKLTVGGKPVLLNATGDTHPSATPAASGKWRVNSAGQTKLTAV